MTTQDARINGWKAIGAYFGRDRSTAIRWANTRGLPVHRIPGGKSATVYAIPEELDAWLVSHRDATEEEPLAEGPAASLDSEGHLEATEPEPAPVPARPAPRRRVSLAIGVALVVALCLGAILLRSLASRGESAALPHDAGVRATYLEARDLWALRDHDSLAAAINRLEQVIGREPRFAPAYAALADAYLLLREYGSMPDTVAFPKAQLATSRALELDGQLDSAHRALGFIQYWFEKNPAASIASFEKALQLRPNDAQTHFWFGNVLSDLGEDDRAQTEFATARLLNPGSAAIESEIAWAAWNRGETAEARRLVESLVARHPLFVGSYDILAEVRLSAGDIPGYLAATAELARLRSDSELQRLAGELAAAWNQGREPAFWSALQTASMVEQTRSPFPDHSWAAFVAHLSEERDTLVSILRLAAGQKQTWGAAGRVRRIQQRWGQDAEIAPLLQQLRARPN